jgi:hypothetical protein
VTTLVPYTTTILAALDAMPEGLFVRDLAVTLRRDRADVLLDVEALAEEGHVETAVVFGGAVVCRSTGQVAS